MEDSQAVAFVLSLKDTKEDLPRIMRVFSDFDIKIVHMETRQSKSCTDNPHDLDVFIQATATSKHLNDLIDRLRNISQCVDVHSIYEPSVTDNTSFNDTSRNPDEIHHVPWFPRHISELDIVSNRVLMYGTDLDADHPGFKDEEYRQRRQFYTNIAYEYRHGQHLPKVEYTESEKKTWRCVYRGLLELYKTHACKEHLENLKLLQQHAGYKESDLPQLEDVSVFLHSRTGFTVRPVAGYLSSRDFLYGLAFRVFYCTQYIRHHKDPMYTPEPDCCHELLGHVPMLADPKFAEFSQEIGLASLGTSDADVKKLAACYFFSVEFGLCRENGQLRAYGAGLLSSSAELQHALSDRAYVRPFIPSDVANEECLVTTFQNGYFETQSLEEATQKMRQFSKTLDRPFEVIYDPYTQSVDVIDSMEKITQHFNKLKASTDLISRSLNKVEEVDRKRKKPFWVMDDLQPLMHTRSP